MRVAVRCTAVAVAVLLSASCGSSGGASASGEDSLVGGAEAASSGAQAASSGAASEEAPAAAPPRPLDPEAPSTYRPVVRPGKPAHPVVAAAEGRFAATAPATYSDGVSVRVDRVTRRVETGEGRGSFPGRPQTAITLTLTNGSSRTVDLTQVVVTTTYGTPPRFASPVYEHPDAGDFTGTVEPGGTASATYVFSIPPGQARSAVMMVDFDSVHGAAEFTGLEG